MREPSERGVWKGPTEETGRKRDNMRETAGKCRQGEIKPKAPPARATNGSFSPTWPLVKAMSRAEPANSIKWEKRERERWKSTAEENNNHSVSSAAHMSRDCESFSLNFMLQIWTKRGEMWPKTDTSACERFKVCLFYESNECSLRWVMTVTCHF